MSNPFIRSLAAASLAFSLVACGSDDSTGPQLDLTDAEVQDMIDALEAIGSFDVGVSVASAALRNPDVALYTFTMDESEPCPEGGTIRIQGTVSGADDGTSASANLTESFTNCAARSPNSNTLWTFNGAPNIKIMMNSTYNNNTGAYTGNGTVTGALSASSTAGNGNCSFNITMNFQGTNNSESGSVSGTVCGKPYSDSWNDTW